MKKLFLPLVLGLTLNACSVKEDRTLCPCLLNVIMTEAYAPLNDDSEDEWQLTLTGYAEEGMIVEECFGKERLRDTLEYLVKRGNVIMTAWLTDTVMPVSEQCYRIPVGEQAPRLYACSSRIDASGETVYYSVQPHKQYATITLLDDIETDEPFGGRKLIVRGHTCGLDLATMCPVEGPFECQAEPVDHLPERGFQIRIPRQEDSGLELELVPMEDESGFGPVGATATSLRFPLGEVLFAQEFTPADEEMPDYIVWFSATGSTLKVSSIITVRPWK